MAAGNATIGSLKVLLGLDSAKFETGLKSAQSKLGGFGKAAGAGLAGAAVAAAAVGVAIAASVKNSLNAMDDLSKASQKVGVPIEALGKLKYAAELADVSFEQLQTGLRKLSVNMLQTAKGAGGPAAEALQTLGITATDASGRLKAGDAVFAEVAEKFSRMEDGAQKTALATQIFGKAGAELIPLLNEGAAGLAAAGAEAEELGLIFDQKTGTAAENFNDNLTRLKKVGTGVTTQLAASLAPALSNITDVFVGASKNANLMSAVGQGLTAVLKVLASAVIVGVNAFAILGRGVSLTIKVIQQALAGDFAGAMRTYRDGVVANFKQIGETANQIKGIWVGTGKEIVAKADKTSDDIAAPIVKAAGKAQAAAKDIKDAAEDARRYVSSEQNALAGRGLDGDQSKIKELQAKGSAFLAQGLRAEALAVHALAESYLILNSVQVVEIDVARDVVDTTKDIQAAFKNLRTDAVQDFEDIADAFYQIGNAFYQIGNAVDDVFYGAANNDWVGAFSGLVRALGQVRKAFSDAGTTMDKYAALAGIASAAGGAIGGKAGSALKGAASGALAGAQIGSFLPGIGTAVGAVVGGLLGGLGGLLGGGSKSKAKKKAAAEAAERARIEAERRAAEEAAEKRALEVRLLELGTDAVALRAAKEEDFLAAVSPANRALAEQVLAQEKLNDAKAAAAALAQQQADIEREIAVAATDAAGALEIFRAEELAALPDALKPLKLQLYATVDAVNALTLAQEEHAAKVAASDDAVAEARETLADAAAREIGALEDVRDTFARLADDLADFGKELAGLGLNPRAQRASALASFNALRGKTDEASLAALPEAGRALIEAARATAPNRKALDAVIAQVRAQVAAGEAAARARVSDAQRQIDAIHQLVDPLIAIRDAALSIAEAMARLSNALYEQQLTLSRQSQALYDLVAAIPPPPAPGAALTNAAIAAAATPAANGNAAEAFAEALAPYLIPIVINTGRTERALDDVINGDQAFNTVAA